MNECPISAPVTLLRHTSACSSSCIEDFGKSTNNPGKSWEKTTSVDLAWKCGKGDFLFFYLKCKCRAGFFSSLKLSWYCFTANSINYTLFIPIFICFLLFSCILNVSAGERCCRAHCIPSHSLCICLLTGNTTDKDGRRKLAHKNCLFNTSPCPIIPVNLICRFYSEINKGDRW